MGTSVVKLLLSLFIFVPLAVIFDLQPDFMLLGGCVLFAGFIAAKEG